MNVGKDNATGRDLRIEALFDVLSSCLDPDKARRTAAALIEKYGTVYTVLSESADELSYIENMGMNAALLLKLAGYASSRCAQDDIVEGRVYSDAELMLFARKLYAGLSLETVYIILLDDDDAVLHFELVGEGTVVGSDIYPRKILECARRYRAHGLILIHNHPKGIAEASDEDIKTTAELHRIFLSYDLVLKAHYIVADGSVGKVNIPSF